MQPIETVWEPTRVFLLQVGHFVPLALLAILIVIVGWLLAKAIRFTVVKALRAINFHVLTERAGKVTKSELQLILGGVDIVLGRAERP